MKKRKPNHPPISIYFVISGGFLLLVAAILLATQNSPDASMPVTSQEETYSEISRVSPDDAKSALDGGTAVIVDVRSAEAYEASHISGAINIPSAELETRFGELDKKQWIITYCT
jgi:3-mercaptopyruvate sulfurtransferase SseA